MTTGRSAGLVVYRGAGTDLEVLLGHLGGPFWARREAGAWTIPKGEPVQGEDLLDAARREFTEELGLPVPPGGCSRSARSSSAVANGSPPGPSPATSTRRPSCRAPSRWSGHRGRAGPPRSRSSTASRGSTSATRGQRIVSGQRELLERLLALVTP